MRKLMIAFLLLAGVMYTSAFKEVDTLDLKFNLSKGSRYEYATNMEIQINQIVMEQQLQLKYGIGITYLFEVLNDSADWKTLKATITRISTDVNAMGQSISIDTDKSSDTSSEIGNAIKMFNAMKEGQFHFTMNSKGQVGSVTGIQEMIQKISNSFPNDEQAMAGMAENFTEESFQQNMEQTFGVYPDKPVKVGDSWIKSTVMKNQGMTIKADNTYTLESVKGDDATIKVVSKLSSDSSAIQPGMTMKIDGTTNGNMHFDVPTGLATEGKMDMKMDMKMNAQGQEMPMKMDMIITIKGKKQ